MKDADYDVQPDNARQIFDAFASVVLQLQDQYNGNAPIELSFCPIGYPENAAIVAKHGLDFSRLPAVQVNAVYPDGSRRVYFLKTGLGGIEFTPETARPYVEALLYDRKSKEVPLICKVLPPLCEVGVWFWLAAFAYSAYRTTQAHNVGKAVWGGATLLSGEAFVKRGGIDHIKKMISK